MTEPESDVLPLLRAFWADGGVPSERFEYLAFQARRYPSIVKFLRGQGPSDGRTVLDLGGGVGGLAVALHATLGGKYALADFFPASGALSAALASRGVPETFRVDLTAEDPLAGLPEFDLILFVEVLEHLLVNPLELFARLRAHLTTGGRLFLTTPNQARLSNRWKLLRGRSIKEDGRFPTDGSGVYGHVMEYTVDELDRLLTYSGFRPIRVEVIQQIPNVHPTAAQRLAPRLLNSALLRRWKLGDDILALYEKTPGAPDRSFLPARI